MTNVARTTASSSTVFESLDETPGSGQAASSQDAVRSSAAADGTLGQLSRIERLPFELKAKIFRFLDPVSARNLGSTGVSLNLAYQKAVEFKCVDSIDSVRQRHAELRQKIARLPDRQSMEQLGPLFDEADFLLGMALKPSQAKRLCNDLISALSIRGDSAVARLAVLSRCADIFLRMPDPAAARSALDQGLCLLRERAMQFSPPVSVLSAPFSAFLDCACKCIGAWCRAGAVDGLQMSGDALVLLGQLFEHTPTHQQSELALRLMRPHPDGIIPPQVPDRSIAAVAHATQVDLATTLGLLDAISGGMRMGGCSIEVVQRLCDLCRQAPRFEEFAFGLMDGADAKLQRLIRRLPHEERAAGEACHASLQEDIKRRIELKREAERLKKTAADAIALADQRRPGVLGRLANSFLRKSRKST